MKTTNEVYDRDTTNMVMEQSCTKGPAYTQARFIRDMHCEELGSEILFQERHCLRNCISYIVKEVLESSVLQNHYSRGNYPECKTSTHHTGNIGFESFQYTEAITSSVNDPMIFLRNDIRSAFSSVELERVEITQMTTNAPAGFEVYILDIVGTIYNGARQ